MLVGVSEMERTGDPLPTGTVTLLAADVDGAAELWAGRPEEMTTAMAQLDRAVAIVTAAHGGVRAVAPGRPDGFLVAFVRASDALAGALALHQASPAPIRLRIGVHTGEVRSHQYDDGVDPAVGRAIRLRDVAHGGQTLLSGVSGQLVADRLPADSWVIDLGLHLAPGETRPERVLQLCHPGVRNDFPLPGVTEQVVGRGLPMHLTSFVGREAELTGLRQLIRDNRLVTLTGAGGVGKTRLAAQLAGQLADRYTAGVCWVDLAAITDPGVVAVAAAQTLGLPDQPGGSTSETLIRFIADRKLLLVLDNCEHLLDACATLVTAVLGRCPGLRIIATSREPIGVAGEVTWRTPSLSHGDEAVELFAERARLIRADFTVTGQNAEMVAEICRRLDGIPLAIELAAARVRALSLSEIVDSLHDRFRLLTGGARTAVRRQQTLRASVDWSHALLTESERVLFRRLAVFSGGFDLDAAYPVAGGAGAPRYQILDELTLLVDKSLLSADDRGRATRYRMLETVRQYALEKLVESDEADAVRSRHRDHYTDLAGSLGATATGSYRARIERTETELDNFRTAFAWSRDNADTAVALQLASSLQPLWLRGRILEGLAWFEALPADGPDAAPAAYARALADKTILDAVTGAFGRVDQTEPALAIARRLGDPALLARTLAACGATFGFSAEVAAPYLAEAVELARASGDDWQLSQILRWVALSAFTAGDPNAARAAAEEGRDLADVIGDRFISRICRWHIGLARWMSAEFAEAVAQFSDVVAEARSAHDPLWQVYGYFARSKALAYQGDVDGARVAAEAAVESAGGLPDFQRVLSFGALADAALAAGDVAAAVVAVAAASEAGPQPQLLAVNGYPAAQTALAAGDLGTARQLADVTVSAASGGHRLIALATRVRVAIAERDFRQAERDAHEALTIATETQAYLTVPDVIECLAILSLDNGSHREAARLGGAAAALRGRTGEVRFRIYDRDYAAAMQAVREVLGGSDFETAWAEGSALSRAEAIAYAQRGHGERKRPPSGWAALTATELDVVELVNQGLTNKEVATRLFVSPRTVQTHLTHIYAKLGLTSRVQLVQQATAQA